MAFCSSSAGRHAARPAAARELGAGGASAAANGCRPRRRLLRCRCDAGEQQDGAVVGAPAPLLTSKTAQRLKVSMMSLGCPKNVVDGAQPHGHAWRPRRCVSCSRSGARRAALAVALRWPALRAGSHTLRLRQCRPRKPSRRLLSLAARHASHAKSDANTPHTAAHAGEVMLGDLFREGFDITVRTVTLAPQSHPAHAACAACRLRTRTRTPLW